MAWSERVRMKSKLKWAALGGLVLSFASIMVHLFLANSSGRYAQYSALTAFTEDLNHIESPGRKGAGYRRLWGKVKSLEPLKPYANPRSVPYLGNVLDLLLLGLRTFSGCGILFQTNRTMVLSMQKNLVALRRLEPRSKFKSFSYLYDEEQFIKALAGDVTNVKSLPSSLMEGRKQRQYPIIKPKSYSSAKFYLHEVLPKLKSAKVVGLILADGGGLQSTLPSSLVEYQRLRCRVAFHALHFRVDIVGLAHRVVEKLRGSGQPYLAYHPGLKRDTLAYHGCADIYQDVHTELIQYRRAQMIKQGIIKEDLNVDSYARKGNGLCPLMPEEIGVLLRAMGYPPRTRIYLAGSETFGGQRVLIPLRAMYANLVDRTSLCSKLELADITGPETELPADSFEFPLTKSSKLLKEELDKAGPHPRPLPPPLERPIYRHEKEGWYRWIAERDSEPDPSPIGLRDQAHRLLWDAIDYIVSVEADAFSGFDNDGSGWPDFSGLAMGHRLYKMASSRTYRPDRKYLNELLNTTSDHLYHPPHNWTFAVREHLNKSMSVDGIMQEAQRAKPKSFLSHPLPECSCTSVKSVNFQKGIRFHTLYGGQETQDACPQGLEQTLGTTIGSQESSGDDNETQEDESDTDLQESDDNSQVDTVPSVEQDEEMDPDD